MADAEGLLRELAGRHKVATAFWGWDGAEHPVSDATLRAVLGALGVPVGSTDDMLAALDEADLEPWRRLLPPAVVTREGHEAPVQVHVPHGRPVSVWVTTENGTSYTVRQVDDWEEPRTVDGVLTGRAVFLLPSDLPLGWHTLHADTDGRTASSTLVVTPTQLSTTQQLAEGRRWGLMAQLYSVRSRRSWGIGDFGDLADLAAVAGAEGAGFVLVNPLHAAEPVPPIQDSPYLPTTRRFVNPLYLRIEDIPEYGYLNPEDRAHVEELARERAAANSSPGLLNRDATFAAKLAALELVWHVPRSPAREQAYRRFRDGAGPGLDDFALWSALAAAPQTDDAAPSWPAPGSAEADRLKEQLADRVDFYRWLQWLCDEQLEAAQRTAQDCGMDLGLIHDLAVGVRPDGADAWTLSGTLAEGVSVGAPPDVFNQQGQDWSQPPWHPGRLAESGYAPYRDMLRTILRHAGGIRVDHILGLFRLWWIPGGGSPAEGTYVYYDHEALVGILALEAQRAGAVVIGEDLGVFEPWVRDYLAERGIFGTSILWFENDAEGRPLEPERYRQQCLTSVNTHDLPPTAGYLAGEHVRLRESLGLLERPLEEELAAAASELEGMMGLLRERGLLPEAGGSAADEQRTIEALYTLTTLTPSALLGVALVDAVGDRRTQNQPGTHLEHPNWRIPLTGHDGEAVLIEDLAANPRFASLVSTIRGALGS
ncbi:4-alpha-glucanotransferase [Sinomonas atrocyanea]|uniref:4-alpha-glucanotransferase n=1 Tax=Sinomonas atrocyanea TaxID=37927 RepID=UPI003D98794D